MALPFLSAKHPKRRDQILAVDLGGHTTKAVSIQRRSGGFELTGCAALDAPASDKTISADLLGEHLKAVASNFKGRCKAVSLAVSLNESFVRQVDLPVMSREDLRLLLKTGSKNYLQQEYSNYIFDCEPLSASKVADEAPTPKGAMAKHKVLVAGAKAEFLEGVQNAARESGFVADHIIPNMIGPINAFEFSHPEEFAKQTVGLVDLGFHGCTISILAEGDMVLSRVLSVGSDRLTAELAESLGISYAEAEGIKVGMPWEVQGQLEALIGPVGRELRASLDFYEHQHDRPVGKVYVSGGAARSDLILQILQAELMVECRAWNPTSFLTLSLPPHQQAELEQMAPQLAVAVGTAMATL
jgi:type IV pilus assembly protein PilM